MALSREWSRYEKVNSMKAILCKLRNYRKVMRDELFMQGHSWLPLICKSVRSCNKQICHPHTWKWLALWKRCILRDSNLECCQEISLTSQCLQIKCSLSERASTRRGAGQERGNERRSGCEWELFNGKRRMHTLSRFVARFLDIYNIIHVSDVALKKLSKQLEPEVIFFGEAYFSKL